MIDIDFGPIALAIFILYTIVFLIGFTIVLFPSMFLYRTLKKRPLWSHRPLFVFTLLASVLGGFLAHQFLLIWDRAEEDASWAQYQAFGKKMEHDYPLEIQYHPDHLTTNSLNWCFLCRQRVFTIYMCLGFLKEKVKITLT